MVNPFLFNSFRGYRALLFIPLPYPSVLYTVYFWPNHTVPSMTSVSLNPPGSSISIHGQNQLFISPNNQDSTSVSCRTLKINILDPRQTIEVKELRDNDREARSYSFSGSMLYFDISKFITDSTLLISLGFFHEGIIICSSLPFSLFGSFNILYIYIRPSVIVVIIY